jgi:hypothetical protein
MDDPLIQEFLLRAQDFKHIKSQAFVESFNSINSLED